MIAYSIEPVMQEWFVNDLVECLTDRPASPLLLYPTVHLFTSLSGIISPQSDVSQFTEATFPGYASQLASFAGPVSFANSAGLAVEADLTFSASTDIVGPGESVIGYWVDNGSLPLVLLPGRQQAFALPKPLGRLVPGPTNLYCAELFPAPLTFSIPYDYLSFTVRIGVPFQSLSLILAELYQLELSAPLCWYDYAL